VGPDQDCPGKVRGVIKSVTWDWSLVMDREACRGLRRALMTGSPDLAKRWGKRFWQSCREKAKSGVWRPPHRTPDFFLFAPSEYGHDLRGSGARGLPGQDRGHASLGVSSCRGDESDSQGRAETQDQAQPEVLSASNRRWLCGELKFGLIDRNSIAKTHRSS